jgi:predicted aldo/keto reductase-like oxidoreductase
MGAAASAGTLAAAARAEDKSPAGAGGALPRRPLGLDGTTLPVVGFPALALKNHDQAECTAAVRRALDAGVDYFDVAPAYGRDGECEIKLGIALQGVPRERYFLATKTKFDDAGNASRELERSLERLKTGYFDLYQLHCLQRPDEVIEALAPGGSMETVLKAKEAGKVRRVGFSAHTTKAALAALEGHAFDSCMFPLNFVEWFKIGFGKPVVELAAKKGVALISIKPVSRGLWPPGVEKTYNWWYRPLEDSAETRMAMNWTLSLPGMVSTLPASYLDVFERTVTAARAARQVTPAETAELERIAGECLSIFEREERAVAGGAADWPALPGSPHDHRRKLG